MSLLTIPYRFAIVGLVCAATHTAIVLVADRWHLHYGLSCVISFFVVVILGFLLHARFTFAQVPTVAAFARYALSMAANYPFTLGLLFLMCDVAGWPVAIATPTATVLLMVWNVLASRWAIVKPPARAGVEADTGKAKLTPRTRPT